MSIIESEYYEWLTALVCENRFPEQIGYTKLLSYLYDTEFTYKHPKDRNRAEDGLDLRYRFSREREPMVYNIFSFIDGPCNLLEMMVALAIRCEENIMDDPRIGNRTSQWFWGMVVSLGLGSMYDRIFNMQFVEETIARFLNREYDPDGRGGLFTIRDCDQDLRSVEIWYQLCWYLDSIT